NHPSYGSQVPIRPAPARAPPPPIPVTAAPLSRPRSQMLDRRRFLLGGVTLVASQGSSASPVAISLDPPPLLIGPIIRGKNSSPGMPTQPSADGRGWSFNFPAHDGVHYVTAPLSGPPLGRGEVKVRFSIAGLGRLVPTQGEPPARMRLFLHRRGDDW